MLHSAGWVVLLALFAAEAVILYFLVAGLDLIYSFTSWDIFGLVSCYGMVAFFSFLVFVHWLAIPVELITCLRGGMPIIRKHSYLFGYTALLTLLTLGALAIAVIFFIVDLDNNDDTASSEFIISVVFFVFSVLFICCCAFSVTRRTFHHADFVKLLDGESENGSVRNMTNGTSTPRRDPELVELDTIARTGSYVVIDTDNLPVPEANETLEWDQMEFNNDQLTTAAAGDVPVVMTSSQRKKQAKEEKKRAKAEEKRAKAEAKAEAKRAQSANQDVVIPPPPPPPAAASSPKSSGSAPPPPGPAPAADELLHPHHQIESSPAPEPVGDRASFSSHPPPPLDVAVVPTAAPVAIMPPPPPPAETKPISSAGIPPPPGPAPDLTHPVVATAAAEATSQPETPTKQGHKRTPSATPQDVAAVLSKGRRGHRRTSSGVSVGGGPSIGVLAKAVSKFLAKRTEYVDSDEEFGAEGAWDEWDEEAGSFSRAASFDLVGGDLPAVVTVAMVVGADTVSAEEAEAALARQAEGWEMKIAAEFAGRFSLDPEAVHISIESSRDGGYVVTISYSGPSDFDVSQAQYEAFIETTIFDNWHGPDSLNVSGFTRI